MACNLGCYFLDCLESIAMLMVRCASSWPNESFINSKMPQEREDKVLMWSKIATTPRRLAGE
jgi:hypothetical protein